jgi:hypothetical protein
MASHTVPLEKEDASNVHKKAKTSQFEFKNEREREREEKREETREEDEARVVSEGSDDGEGESSSERSQSVMSNLTPEPLLGRVLLRRRAAIQHERLVKKEKAEKKAKAEAAAMMISMHQQQGGEGCSALGAVSSAKKIQNQQQGEGCSSSASSALAVPSSKKIPSLVRSHSSGSSNGASSSWAIPMLRQQPAECYHTPKTPASLKRKRIRTRTRSPATPNLKKVRHRRQRFHSLYILFACYRFID